MVDKIIMDHFLASLNLENNLEVFLDAVGRRKLPKNIANQIIAIYGISEDPTYEHEDELDVDISDDIEDDYLILSPVESSRYCVVLKVKGTYRIYHTFEDDEEQYGEVYPTLEDVIWSLEAMYDSIPNKEELLALV